jgi:uncharacterized membrane protein HdeD (DUF308 family)
VPTPPPSPPTSRDAIRGLASSWGLLLALGVVWILFGTFVLSYNFGSLLALVVLAGVTFTFTGITQALTAGLMKNWLWLHVVGGIVSILIGIIAFVWPRPTLLVLTGILAWFLAFKSIVDVIGALTNLGQPIWWERLILGILELLLGIWAAGYQGRSAFVFVNLVGTYAVLYGLAEIFAAFNLMLPRREADRASTARLLE